MPSATRRLQVGELFDRRRTVSVRSADELDSICGIDDLDALIVFEIAQVRITGDDQIGRRGERTGKYRIVIGIVFDVRVDVGGNDLFGEQCIARYQLRNA